MNSESVDNTFSKTPFDIKVRKDLVWDFSDVPANFCGDDNPLIGYFWATLSMGATPIESFFIKTLLPTVETITGDEKLQKDVKDMIAQEAQHSATHRMLNDRLATLGYDMDGLKIHFENIINQMTDGLTPIDMLGVVAAGEHALYAFAQTWLNDAPTRESMHPQVRRVFNYHLLEEAEHGAVSHDQYHYFSDNRYWHRIKTAARARHVVRGLLGGISICARGFNYKPSVRDRLGLIYYMLISPGPLRRMSYRILEYVSPTYKLTFTHQDMETMKRFHEELYAGQPKV